MNIFKVKFSKDRIYGLDLLRAFAILFIMIGHSRYRIPSLIDNKYYKFLMVDGVAIFFVLSGFLIGGILIKIIEKNSFTFKELVNFWIRRWFRTLPNYFIIITLTVLLSWFLKEEIHVYTWEYYLFLQNLIFVEHYFFPEAWSLSVEEWFYLTVPLLIFGSLKIIKNSKQVVLFWVIFIISVATIIRLCRVYNLDCDSMLCWQTYIRGPVVTRLDSIMFGVLVAYLNKFYSVYWRFFQKNNYLFWSGIFLIILPQVNQLLLKISFIDNYLSFTLVSIGVSFILPRLTVFKINNGWFYKFVTVTSIISYSMYLINYTIIGDLILNNLISVHRYIAYVLFWILSYLFSIIFYNLIEVPFMKFRDIIKV